MYAALVGSEETIKKCHMGFICPPQASQAQCHAPMCARPRVIITPIHWEMPLGGARGIYLMSWRDELSHRQSSTPWMQTMYGTWRTRLHAQKRFMSTTGGGAKPLSEAGSPPRTPELPPSWDPQFSMALENTSGGRHG